MFNIKGVFWIPRCCDVTWLIRWLHCLLCHANNSHSFQTHHSTWRTFLSCHFTIRSHSSFMSHLHDHQHKCTHLIYPSMSLCALRFLLVVHVSLFINRFASRWTLCVSLQLSISFCSLIKSIRSSLRIFVHGKYNHFSLLWTISCFGRCGHLYCISIRINDRLKHNHTHTLSLSLSLTTPQHKSILYSFYQDVVRCFQKYNSF